MFACVYPIVDSGIGRKLIVVGVSKLLNDNFCLIGNTVLKGSLKFND